MVYFFPLDFLTLAFLLAMGLAATFLPVFWATMASLALMFLAARSSAFFLVTAA